MKITDIRTLIVGNPWKNWVFVIVETSSGISGLGEATGGLQTMPNKESVEEIKHLAIGKNPLEITNLIDELYKASFLKITQAISSIEIACWDILGQYLKVPIHQILGGKVRDKVRVYANGWYSGERTPENFGEKAKLIADKGYTALKFDPFGSEYMRLNKDSVALIKSIIKCVRDNVGDKVELMIEGHKRFNSSEAIKISHWLKDYEITWFEDPIDNDDIDSLIHVANKSPVRIIAGEGFKKHKDFTRFASSNSTDIMNPEVMAIGGISGAMSVAAICSSFDVDLAFHNAESPLKTMTNLQLCGAIKNIYIQECFDDFNEDWINELFPNYEKVNKGYLSIPDKPGLGISINENVAKDHPYNKSNFLRMFKPGWENRKGASSVE
jgi:galactonate dehydratase